MAISSFSSTFCHHLLVKRHARVCQSPSPASKAKTFPLLSPEGTNPVYVGDGQHTKFYIRTGNTTQELTTKESVEYVKSRWS